MMKLKSLIFGISLAAAAIVPLGAQASVLSFVISGVDAASFTFDSNPIPSGQTGVADFYFTNVAGTLSNAPKTFEYVTFYASGNFGGLRAGLQPGDFGTNYFHLLGPQLFSGSNTAPAFSVGTFSLSGGDTLS